MVRGLGLRPRAGGEWLPAVWGFPAAAGEGEWLNAEARGAGLSWACERLFSPASPPPHLHLALLG